MLKNQSLHSRYFGLSRARSKKQDSKLQRSRNNSIRQSWPKKTAQRLEPRRWIKRSPLVPSTPRRRHPQRRRQLFNTQIQASHRRQLFNLTPQTIRQGFRFSSSPAPSCLCCLHATLRPRSLQPRYLASRMISTLLMSKFSHTVYMVSLALSANRCVQESDGMGVHSSSRYPHSRRFGAKPTSISL